MDLKVYPPYNISGTDPAMSCYIHSGYGIVTRKLYSYWSLDVMYSISARLMSWGDQAFLHLIASLVFRARVSGLRDRNTRKDIALRQSDSTYILASTFTSYANLCFLTCKVEVIMVIMRTQRWLLGPNNTCEGDLSLGTLCSGTVAVNQIRTQTEAILPGSWLFHLDLHDLEPLQATPSLSIK